MRQNGLTLLECLIGLILMTILLGVGLKAWERTLARHRVHAATQQVLMLMHQARATAMAGPGLYLCDGERGCGRFGWTRHLVLQSTPDTTAPAVQHLVLPNDTRVRWKGFRGQSLFYGPRGHTLFQNGHFLICHLRGLGPPRKIVVNWIGRPRVEPALAEDCQALPPAP